MSAPAFTADPNAKVRVVVQCPEPVTLAGAAALAATKLYYQSLGLTVTAEPLTVTEGDDDPAHALAAHVSYDGPILGHHVAMRLKAPVVLPSTGPGTYGVDFGESAAGVAGRYLKANFVAPAVGPCKTLQHLLLPLADDLSPGFRPLDVGELLMFAPAGGPTMLATAEMTAFLRELNADGHVTRRRNKLPQKVAAEEVKSVADVLRCVVFLLPNNSWLQSGVVGAGAILAAIKAVKTDRRVFVAALVLDGQVPDDCGAAVLAAADIVLARDSAPRGLRAGVPTVMLPGLLKAPAVTLDVLAQCVGACEAGTPGVIATMVTAAAGEGYPVLPVSRLAAPPKPEEGGGGGAGAPFVPV
jgi:hypothetical protein